MSTFMIIIAALLSLIVVVRSVCVLYHSHWSKCLCGRGFFWAFGFTYISLASAAVSSFIYLWTRDGRYLTLAMWLFLFGNAGLILFDRRKRDSRGRDTFN